MSNPLFHNIPPVTKAIYFLLMTFFTGAFMVFIGMMVIAWMSGTGMDAIEGLMQEPDNPDYLPVIRILTTMNQIGAFLVASYFFARVFGKESIEGFYFKKFDLKLWLIIPVTMLAASPIIDITMRFNNWIIPEGSWVESWFKPMEESAAELTDALLQMDDPMMLLINLIMIAVLPALGEEIAFRGILQNQVAKATGNIHLAVWISAILFSAYHLQFYGFIPRMLLGAFFGYLVVWTGSIWPSIIAHFVNNASAVLVVYFTQEDIGFNQEVLSSEEAPGLSIIAFGILIFSIGLFLVWRDSKWLQIKDRYLSWKKIPIDV